MWLQLGVKGVNAAGQLTWQGTAPEMQCQKGISEQNVSVWVKRGAAAFLLSDYIFSLHFTKY